MVTSGRRFGIQRSVIFVERIRIHHGCRIDQKSFRVTIRALISFVETDTLGCCSVVVPTTFWYVFISPVSYHTDLIHLPLHNLISIDSSGESQMKRFLLTNPSNKRWVEGQERLHKAQKTASDVARLVRQEIFPAFHPETVQSNILSKDLFMEATQRQNHRAVMKELLQKHGGKKKQKETTTVYRTMTWEQKAKALFFYFHKSLGNEMEEVTCSLFSINVMTFRNWINQKLYFPKWVPYVEGFVASDVLPSVPEAYKKNYESVDAKSRVKLGSKYHSVSTGPKYVTAVSSGTRQHNKNLEKKSQGFKYISKTTKTIGSGRKTKYPEQETFLVEMMIVKWETGNPMSKSAAYDMLINKFGHVNEADQSEWEKK